MAADLAPVVPMTPVAIVAAPAGFDWGGLYGGASFIRAPAVAGHLGYNLVRDRLLFGAEAVVGVGAPFPTFFAGAGVRVGALLGDRQRLLVYAALHALYVPAATSLCIFGTGGAEFAVGQRVSMFAEAGAVGTLGGACCGLTVRAGVSVHVGR